ncbi:MAG TPA: GMP synthase [Chitinophagales bacterium]|nr:GMP synthase [Chitinophagales bacterium]
MDKPTIKVAVLDLYNREKNEGMRCIRSLLYLEKLKTDARVRWDIFDVRNAEEIPDESYDVYISSGGPGSPLASGEAWEKKYFQLIDNLWEHNLKNADHKKHAFFICHSFQLLCRHWKVGEVTKRKSTSFGVLPIHETEEAANEPLFEKLPEPFYAVDSRDYQVVQPNQKLMEREGYQLLALEKPRPHVGLERAMMAVRFSDEFIGTQFHPEADPQGMLRYFSRPDKKEIIIKHHGVEKYYQMVDYLDDPDKIVLTQQTILPTFLNNSFDKVLETADCV